MPVDVKVSTGIGMFAGFPRRMIIMAGGRIALCGLSLGYRFPGDSGCMWLTSGNVPVAS
jgi:hypothetical protein